MQKNNQRLLQKNVVTSQPTAFVDHNLFQMMAFPYANLNSF